MAIIRSSPSVGLKFEFINRSQSEKIANINTKACFEHLFDKNDDANGLSVPVSFELTPDFFKGFIINNSLELYLGADRPKEEFTREVIYLA